MLSFKTGFDQLREAALAVGVANVGDNDRDVVDKVCAVLNERKAKVAEKANVGNSGTKLKN